MKVEILDEKGNLVEILERPDCWGGMTENTDERGCDDCLYCEECMEATSDINEEDDPE